MATAEAWAEAERVAARVYGEEANWCSTGGSYVLRFLGSTALTGLAHAAVRLVADRWRAPAVAVDWDSRVVGTVNAVIAVRAYAALREPLRWSTSSYDAVAAASCERDAAMLSLAGYLFFDLLVCFVLRSRGSGGTSTTGGYDDPLVLAHHAIVVLAFFVGVATRLATAYMAALLVNEASTPFVNVRTFINVRWPPPRPRSSPAQVAYVLNGLCLVASYFLCRVAWTAAVVAHAARAWAHLWRVGLLVRGYRLLVVVVLSSLLLAHLLINCLWFTHVIHHLLRQLRPLLSSSGARRRDPRGTTTTKKHDDNGNASSAAVEGDTKPLSLSRRRPVVAARVVAAQPPPRR